MTASRALVQIGPRARPAIQPLMTALGNSKAEVREQAAATLGELRLATDDVLPALVVVLSDHPQGAKAAAYTALWQMDPEWQTHKRVKENVPALLKSLEHRDPNVRAYPIAALGWIGPAASPAVPSQKHCLCSHPTSPLPLHERLG